MPGPRRVLFIFEGSAVIVYFSRIFIYYVFYLYYALCNPGTKGSTEQPSQTFHTEDAHLHLGGVGLTSFTQCRSGPRQLHSVKVKSGCGRPAHTQ